MNCDTETVPPKPDEAEKWLRPERWLDDYGDALYSYAWTRLRDKPAAEDLVQQTFLEAFKARSRYRAEIPEKAWLFTILRHNLVDLIRRKALLSAHPGRSPATPEIPNAFEESGFQRGKWKSGFEPVELRSPATDLMDAEFWKAFHRCVSKLPAAAARVVLLREIDNLPSEEICSIAGISQQNFWVICHRARVALQQCLKKEWLQ